MSQNDYTPAPGEPEEFVQQRRNALPTPAKQPADERLARTDCSPLRVAYSRAELADKLKDWMVEMWGHPMELSEESRDRWMERNGLLYHFISDHFPSENAELTHPDPKP